MAIESRKSNKRKSRDRDDFDGSDTNGSTRKKRSEKNEKKREQKRLSRLQHGRIASPESSARGEGKLDEPTSATPLTAARHTKVPVPHLDGLDITETRTSRERDEAKSIKHRNSNLSMTGRRTSLGSNREALLQSILKSCGTEKSAINKTEAYSSIRV